MASSANGALARESQVSGKPELARTSAHGAEIGVEKMKTITIALSDSEKSKTVKKRRVKAEIIGAFAIFPNERGWNITHIPTGRRLFYCSTKSKAHKAVVAMSQGLDWNWGEFGIIAKRKPKHYARAKEAFEQYGGFIV